MVSASFDRPPVSATGETVGAGPEGVADRKGVASSDLETFIAAHGGLVYRLAVAIVHDHSLAEDVVQDVMLKAWRNLPDHDGDVPVRWLRTVTRNASIDLLRQRRFDEVTTTPPEPGSSTAQPDRIIEGRQHLDALWDALGNLDQDARTMLVLRETESMGYDEIAATIGISPSAVKAKLYRARHQLRLTLIDWDDA